MSRELWLLRHGKSNWNIMTNDFDRPLKNRGKKAAQRLGNWMKQQGLMPDVVISSPAERALATAIIVCEEIGIPEQAIQRDMRLYGEGFDCIKTVLADIPGNAKKVLLIGHNPELEDLLVYLAGASNVPTVDKLLPTATLARVLMRDDWSHLRSGRDRLISITQAKFLSEPINCNEGQVQ